MTGQPKKDTLIVLDFDGTLYRGSCPTLFRGIANADLLGVLCVLRMFSPKRLGRLVSEAIQLWRYERRTRREYQSGRLSLSEADRRTVRFFEERVLPSCTRAELNKAAAVVSRLCHRSAWRCLSGARERCDCVVVSKSFDFLLRQVALRAAECGCELRCFGNRAGCVGGGEAQSVLVRSDKADRVRALLGDGGYRRAVVVGDTEDDIVMRDAAVAVLGASAVSLVCMNGKDRRIVAEADRRVTSWREVGVMLSNFSV